MKKPIVLIMAGGTGGHIFPAMAVAQQFINQGCEIHWLGAQKGLEQTLIPEKNWPLHSLKISGFVNKSFVKKILYVFELAGAVFQAKKIINKINPDIVIGFGGFPAAPGGLAAKLSGKWLAIHEQNAVAGKTNKMLAKFAHIILEGFPGAFVDDVNTQYVGNPIRSEIEPVKWTKSKDVFNILIVGGSLGARGINLLLPDVIDLLDGDNINVCHQVGRNNKDLIEKLYRSNCKNKSIQNIEVLEFIDDMAAKYRWADLIVCRSGASTVCEVSHVGMPAIYIPYPYHKDQQQLKNTEFVVNAKGAFVCEEFDTQATTLAQKINNLITNNELLNKMSVQALTCAKQQSAQIIVQQCLKLSNEYYL
ncbi:MAG: undecaprenyldiphospho-muramoylpentapeptide beta-N-acetylglucosaminyltransferase [Saccharospirillaceae bacterium]|nr:undecaprenyldiphospho-muramoylpentapeptide beta-N-acetylglucosaminyltransferase [Pseudomonadales bacterium]NRB78196.1 undecaprenyldiphospho-muramoylpentapeptide beta-N-acetylglucosaminyltransferase [Saccharospirillaceae bacterium]